MKRKLLAICLASLTILQLGGVTIFAQNQEPELVAADVATVDIELFETKSELKTKNDDQIILPDDSIEKQVEDEADGDIYATNDNDTEIFESNLDGTEAQDNTLIDDNAESNFESETSDMIEAVADATANDELIETSSETVEESDNAEQIVVSGTSDVTKMDLEDEDIVMTEQTEEQLEKIEKLSFNRNNIVEGDFFADMEMYIEYNSEIVADSLYMGNEVGLYNTDGNETLTIDDLVYDTAPIIESATFLRTSTTEPETNGMRFKATVTADQRALATEYGFLIANTESLEGNNLELTFDLTEITFLSGVAYSVEDGINKYIEVDENGNYVYSMVLLNIPETAYVKEVTARPYIIYNIDGVETIVYGNTYSNNIYRTAKSELVSSDDDAVIAYAQSIIDTAENGSAYLDSAAEVSLDERVDRSVGENPDIDVIKFAPEVSSFYTLTFTSEEEAIYEVLDEFGCELPEIEINNITNETAYLFEEAQTYYIRVKGEPDVAYSIQATPCLQDAIIYDFANDTEGFTFGGGATSVAENGVLNLSIDKSALISKAYMQNTDLSVDLFDYSRLIIRMKNTTNTIKLSGTVGIDLEYDGTTIDYTLDSSMPASMTEYENIEFDFTTRYGEVSSLKLSFGQLLSSLSGNIYIDSIVILPMPEVLAWEFDETLESWGNNAQIDSAIVEDGALVLNMLGSVTGMAPAITSPGTSAYDFDKYDIIKIRLKNETAATNMQVYFTTLADGHTAFNENKKFLVTIEPSSTEYVEYTINLTEHTLFTDSLKDIMISIPSEGTTSIDYIRLSKGRMVYNDVIWGFDTDLEGFYSGNERHVLSANNGAMIVETQTSGSGGFYTPSNIDIPAAEYKYLVLGVNSASVTSDFQAYFKTNAMTSYLETDHDNKIVYKHTLQIEQSDTFREYVIDLTSVPDGYTTGYTGTLEQFMLALPEIGTYEIDYIKLTNGTTDEEFSISATKNSEYKLLISKNNNCTVGTYTVKYDADVFELVDACAFSCPLETESGQANGTDITITSVTDGTITFTVSNKTIAGAINCLKLKAIKSIDSQITVTANVA